MNTHNHTHTTHAHVSINRQEAGHTLHEILVFQSDTDMVTDQSQNRSVKAQQNSEDMYIEVHTTTYV